MDAVPMEFESIGFVMSNCFHEIEEDAEKNLKAGDVYGEYAGWNFYGHVWWDGSKFKCEIRQYHAHVNTIEGDSLQEIMDAASQLYGYK